MTFLTEPEARERLCPIARVSGAEKPSARCVGPSCMLWRWRPVLADDPAFRAAHAKAVSEGMTATKATVEINMNREKYGVPTEPYRGWCGLGGEPKA